MTLDKKIMSQKNSPWKRYYEIRNRILIARKYYGWRLWTETIPGTIVRLITILVTHKDLCSQTKAFAYGLRDGLMGRSGRLWQPGQNKYK